MRDGGKNGHGHGHGHHDGHGMNGSRHTDPPEYKFFSGKMSAESVGCKRVSEFGKERKGKRKPPQGVEGLQV